jgi:hypothetical protein
MHQLEYLQMFKKLMKLKKTNILYYTFMQTQMVKKIIILVILMINY